MMFDRLKEFLLTNNQSSLSKAKFWFEKWKSEFPKEAQSTTDGYEGTARYVEMIASKIKCNIEIKPSNDPRSYKQESSKLLKTGFIPNKTISNAIDEIVKAHDEGWLVDKDQWHTVRWMKLNNIK